VGVAGAGGATGVATGVGTGVVVGFGWFIYLSFRLS